MTVRTIYRVEVTAPDTMGKYWTSEHGDEVRNIVYGRMIPMNSGRL